MWTIENRDAVWSWVGGISKAFEPQKPSPSRQYAQRKLHEDNQVVDGPEMAQEDMSKPPSINQGASSPSKHAEFSGSLLSPPHTAKLENSSSSSAGGKLLENIGNLSQRFLFCVLSICVFYVHTFVTYNQRFIRLL